MFKAEYFSKSFQLVTKEALLFIVGAIILVLIIVVPGAIPVMLGPALAGLFNVALKRSRGEKAEYRDLFYGFENKFGTFVLTGLVFVLVVTGGIWALIIGTFVAAGIWIYMFPLIIDKDLDFTDAFIACLRFLQVDWWKKLLFGTLAVVIAYVGVLLLGVGVVFTLPWAILMLALAYCDHADEFITGPAKKTPPAVKKKKAAAPAKKAAKTAKAAKKAKTKKKTVGEK
jgi:hypothetical protein